MARHKFGGTWITADGKVVGGGTITVYLAGGTTLATCYESESGSALSGSQTTTDSANGGFSFWIDDGDYGSSQRFRIIGTKTGFADLDDTDTTDNLQIVPALATHDHSDSSGGGLIANGAIRASLLRMQPGSTPGTHVTVDADASSTRGYNSPTITTGTDLIKGGGAVGSFSLSADGLVLTMDITEAVTGILGTSVQVNALNTSTTVYFPIVSVVSENITVSLVAEGVVPGAVDFTTIFDASERYDVLINYMTSS